MLRKISISKFAIQNKLIREFSWKSFATVDPSLLSESNPHKVQNLINGKWKYTKQYENVVDPLNGEVFIQAPDTQLDEINEFITSLNSCSKSGLHNPYKNPERYVEYGNISAKAAAKLKDPKVLEYFAHLIQRVAPKSLIQAKAEVSVTQKFLENFSGDQVRFLARSFSVPGDHTGQMSSGYRWPYGPVVVIAPFNFPIEIPLLQMMGALYMGNKVLLKIDSKVSIVMEQALRLLHECGLPLTDVDFINSNGIIMHNLLLQSQPRMTQFTGSVKIAELLCKDLNGKVKLEDAGFDWKVRTYKLTHTYTHIHIHTMLLYKLTQIDLF